MFIVFFLIPQTFPPKNETTVMKVFAVLLHAHYLGRTIILHHFRNGKEIENIAADRNYDFNYQETVFLKKEIEILRVRLTITVYYLLSLINYCY